MSIQSICDAIMNVVEKARAPFPDIAATLIICDAVKRPGLSAKTIASNIIRRQAEAGAPVGPAADGTQNIMEAMEVIRAEEYVKAFHNDGRVMVGIKAGSLHVEGDGANAAGPVHFVGTNMSDTTAVGGTY